MLLPVPRSWKVLLLSCALLVMGATLVVPPDPAAAAQVRRAAEGNTSWQMWGQEGDIISKGEAYAYSGETRISAEGTAGSVKVRVGRTWSADFVAPDGAVLAPGAYADATRAPFSDGGVGLSISGDGRGCNKLAGRFTVHEASFDDAGALTSFSVTFEQHCEGKQPALFGSIAWRAAAPAHPPQPRLSLLGPDGPVRTGECGSP